jgi:hypothetical protein
MHVNLLDCSDPREWGKALVSVSGAFRLHVKNDRPH